MMSDISTHKDFFVSYSSADRLWAEWITWQLEQAGYSVMLQSWHFKPGLNFAAHMQEAVYETKRTIVVLSPDYLDELEKHSGWEQTLRSDPTGGQEVLLPIQVRECRSRLKGLLSLLTYIDLVGRDEEKALEILLAGIQRISASVPKRSDDTAFIEHAVVEQPRFPVTLPRIWNVPPRNLFFTGREEILRQLHDSFANKKTRIQMLSQAISGLGGIGKTQTAIEYAYRYRDEYQAVMWLIADSQDMLVQSCHDLVRALDLPEKDAQDQEEIIAAVRAWLQDHVDWLLILDNADDPSLVREFLPSDASGHILMTTRAQAVGRVAQSIAVVSMPLEVGALFLLRRAGLLGPDEQLQEDDPQWRDAVRIVKEMDGLPLALDQAGGYIEETGCRLAEYLSLYMKNRKRLLGRRGEPIFDHPKSVATTWNLSFEQVQRDNAAAADLLRLCAFLAPDDIPEELVIEGTSDANSPLNVLADDPLAINEVIAELRRYSLMRRDPQNKTLSMHRLVQAVLRDMLSDEERGIWAERAVRAVNAVFPEVKFETWPQCQRYLPHVRVSVTSITQWHMLFPEAASLLHRAGLYLQERAQYADAQQLLQQALAIYEQVVEPDNTSIVKTLNDLAGLSRNMGKYVEAEQHYLRSIAIIERNQGLEHPDGATVLNKQAELYQEQGKYAEAESLYKHALSIFEQQSGSEHLQVATVLNNLAVLYSEQGKYEEANPLYQEVLRIWEEQLGSEHLQVATVLIRLAVLYSEQEKYVEAESLYQRALLIRQQLGPEHPDIASLLNNLAVCYHKQKKYVEAEPLYQEALRIWEQQMGIEHPRVAYSLNNLAELYSDQGKYAEAEPLYQRALYFFERQLGLEHPLIAYPLHGLALLSYKQKKYTEAESLYLRALHIREQSLGSQHPDIADTLHGLAQLREAQGKFQEASALYNRALAIREQAFGLHHPRTTETRSSLIALLHSTGRSEEAALHEAV